MTTAVTSTKPIQRIDRLNEGEWLHELLADTRQQVASRPNAQSIARIRRRLFAEVGAPARRPARVAA